MFKHCFIKFTILHEVFSFVYFVLGHLRPAEFCKLCTKTRSHHHVTHPVTHYPSSVENPPEAEIQPRHLPHTTVHRAARSGDWGLPGAQLGHRGSAVAPAGTQVPQGVPVGGQRGTAGHPRRAQWVAQAQNVMSLAGVVFSCDFCSPVSRRCLWTDPSAVPRVGRTRSFCCKYLSSNHFF